MFCTSPCEITLAFTSEGCTNPACRAYAAPPAPPKEEAKQEEAAFKANVKTERLSSKEPHVSNTPKPDPVKEGRESAKRPSFMASLYPRSPIPFADPFRREVMGQSQEPILKMDYAELEWRVIAQVALQHYGQHGHSRELTSHMLGKEPHKVRASHMEQVEQHLERLAVAGKMPTDVMQLLILLDLISEESINIAKAKGIDPSMIEPWMRKRQDPRSVRQRRLSPRQLEELRQVWSLPVVSSDLPYSRTWAEERDFHTQIASQIFKVPPSQITKEQRDAAKSTELSALYGGLRIISGLDAGLANYAKADAEVTQGLFSAQRLAEARIAGLEKEIPLRHGECLTNRRDCGCKAYVTRVGVDGGYRSEPAILSRRDAKECEHCAGSLLEGTKAALLKWWKRDSESLEAFYSSPQMYKVHRLRWAQTLRVTDRKPGISKNSLGVKLLGVMSLVDVPKRFNGLTAVYEYVSIEYPTTGRFRFTISKGPGPQNERGVVLDRTAWGLTIRFLRLDAESKMNIANIHCPAILSEVHKDLDMNRPVRTPSEAEMAMFAMMRGPHDKKE